MLKSKLVGYACLLILLGIISYQISTQSNPQPPVLSLVQHELHPNKALESSKVLFISESILEPSYLRQSHSASIETLGDGSIIAVWFAGSHEAKHDVQIWQSTYVKGKWSLAQPILSAESLSRDTKSFVF